MLSVLLFQAAAAFLSKPNPGKYAVPSYSDINTPSSSMSPRTSLAQSPLIMSGPFSSAAASNEVQRLREELASNKVKLTSWEEGIAQARSVSAHSITLYYALQFVRPIASLKSYYVTIKQSPFRRVKAILDHAPSYDGSCPHLTRPI
jgi:hypothetical protein